MPVTSGTRFGPYEVLEPLGAGGMGEVYKARDTKLGRDVAVKVLPVGISEDPERLARFEREAKVLASLNHPNIAQIYAIEGGALVMEFVQGKTLAGPLPLDTALDYARQIAEALEAAHDKGIIHRDLKPGNIMITPAGIVKVLDFGLASAPNLEPTNSPESSPTLMLSATKAGTILGTAAYMSPEQAAGSALDKRTDIWSFGLVLWEMLMGKRLFEGETISHTLASVLKDPIDLSSLPKSTPPAVRVLLQRCLDRDRKARLRDIGEARIVLERKPSLVSEEKPAGQATRTVWLWAGISIFGVAAAIGWLRPLPNDRHSMALSIAAPPGAVLITAPVISPDGQSVWYQTRDFRMFLRSIHSLEPRLVPGSAPIPVFWSPDSSAIFHWGASGHLVKTQPSSGVAEVVLSDQEHWGSSGTWSDSGALLLSGTPCLAARAPSGGQLKVLRFDKQEEDSSCGWPEYLPGGDDFVFLLRPANSADSGVYFASMRDGTMTDPVLLLKNRTPAHYTPAAGGRLLYVQNDNLYSQKLNRRARRLKGNPELVLGQVASNPFDAFFSVARNGTIAWRPGRSESAQIAEFDRTGRQVSTSGPPGNYSTIIPSPDGKRLLVDGADGGSLFDVGQPGKLDLPGSMHWYGWSPDGSLLIGAKRDVLVSLSAAGSGDIHELTKVALDPGTSPELSPDGKQIIFSAHGGIYAVELDGNSRQLPPKMVVASSEPIRIPSLSPDGHWIVYDPGLDGIYVRPFPGPGPRKRVGTRGINISFCYWRKDGNEILYFNDGELMSIPVTWHGGNPSFGEARKLFSGLERGPSSGIGTRPLAASRDGSRIFWLQGPDPSKSNVIDLKTYAIR